MEELFLLDGSLPSFVLVSLYFSYLVMVVGLFLIVRLMMMSISDDCNKLLVIRCIIYITYFNA